MKTFTKLKNIKYVISVYYIEQALIQFRELCMLFSATIFLTEVRRLRLLQRLMG